MKVFQIINIVIGCLFALFYAYQTVYAVIAMFIKRKKLPDAEQNNRYAILICARNEENVIGDLIDSIHSQTYDKDKITTFVLADNCTDKTAEAAEKKGVVVYRRENKTEVGKGYALNDLLRMIKKDYPNGFDGYFIFDADNVLDAHYIEEMNKSVALGNDIVTSYRNSKNFGDNWVSAGYGVMFLRESQFLNFPRNVLGLSSFVGGTGYCFTRKIAEELDGWPFRCLTEDAEFSINRILNDQRIAYCPDAVFYDEQPTKFSVSWTQRLRWCKGYWQVFGKYATKLTRGIFDGNFSCYDMTMAIMPAFVLTSLSVVSNIGMIVSGFFEKAGVIAALYSVGSFIWNLYLTAFVLGVLITVTEWRRIDAPASKKILYMFTFPVFMLSFCPIAIQSLFCKVEWKPIEHSRHMDKHE